jgi:hypothetical protein
MQKVVGSSPIIRSEEPAGNGGFFHGRSRWNSRGAARSQPLVSFGRHARGSRLNYAPSVLRLPEPMLARTGPIPTRCGWTFEPKLDGLRCVVWTDAGLRARL